MWWDWSAITLADSVAFSTLTMLVLYFIGYGFLRLISALLRNADPFAVCDTFQKISFRMLFGYIFAFLSVLAFSFFNVPILFSIIITLVLALIGLLLKPLPRFQVPKSFRLKNYFQISVIIIVFAVVLFLASSLIAGFYGSTNDDAAFHTLVVQRIIAQPNVLLNRVSLPNVSYPSGSQVFCAFFLTLFGVSIQKIVIMVSAVLPLMIVLSFYTLIRSLFQNRTFAILGSIISSFFVIGSSWAAISWGGLPFLMSLYLSLCSIALFFEVFKEKMTLLKALLVGLMFFIAIETYPSALLFAFAWILILLGSKLASRMKHKQNMSILRLGFLNRRNLALVLAFIFPILLCVPYLYYVVRFNFVGQNNVGAGSIVLNDIFKARIGFNWLIDLPRLSNLFSSFGGLLALVPVSLVLLVALFVLTALKRTPLFLSNEFTKNLFLVYSCMLLIMGYLTVTLYLPNNLFVHLFSAERVFGNLLIFGVVLTAAVLFFLVSIVDFGLTKLTHVESNNKFFNPRNRRVLACILLATIVFAIGFLCLPTVVNQESQYNGARTQLNAFESLGKDDLSMMNWIINNLPINATILVSSGDSGQYLTPVTHFQTISCHDADYYYNYTDLMGLLTSNASDLRALPLLIQNNVSYVYIGSIATTYALSNPQYREFNSTQFLSSPYFSLAKEIGNVWLFSFNGSAAKERLDISDLAS
jgi:hypothetical protein